MFERIDTICLTVSNLGLASDWYQEVLGHKVSFRGEGYQVLSIGEGSVPLTIEEGDTAGNSNHSCLIYFTSNIKLTYQTLSDRGVRLGELQKDSVNNFFKFYDLDGNKSQVCFYEQPK